MHSAILARIVRDLGLPENSVAATVSLFQAGTTVPFIVRYRKEATGGLDGAQVRAIHERMLYYREVQDRRSSLIKMLFEQGKLNEDIRQKVDVCFTKVELEDLHHQFKPKRRPRAVEAIERGLEPLADYLWNQEPDAWSLEEHADVFVDPEKKVATRDQALLGAVDIIAEWISENFEFRRTLRDMVWKEGFLVSAVVPAKADQKTKYNMYYDRREAVASVPSHRVLAIRRGTKEGILTSSIEGDPAQALEYLLAAVIRDRESVFAPILEIAVREAYSRILMPLVETQVRALLKERADREAIRVFQENLANLLLSPPGGPMVVVGADMGKGDECRLAAVDQTGKLLEETAVSPLPPKSDMEGSRAILRELIAKHGVRVIAIGSGAGTRDLEAVLRQILADEKIDNVVIASVNDAGLAIYSSSRVAREEFPSLSASSRCAISLARRFQDPLSELVKIDPKLIGVGQYQHDVDQKELHRGLLQTVQSCVNRVGVDLNAAHASLIRYVAGLNDRLARKIIAARAGNAHFPSRAAFFASGIIDRPTYDQAAGFLRIRNGENPLDQTAVHPECYPIVERMAATVGVSVGNLIGNRELISSIKLEDFATETVGLPTLVDIREELLKPGRDPRKSFALPKFRADVKGIEDLKEGMTLEGVVTNVTNFGAFVDVGIHQDGLVHLSQMSNRFIRDPREAVKVGDVVQVKILSVEVETKRIGLSMKALMPPVVRRRKKFYRKSTRSAPPARPAPSEKSTAANPTPPPPGEATAEPAATEAGSVAPAGHPGAKKRRSRRRNSRRAEMQGQEGTEATEPKAPEATLQEKIAALQSKFKGIS